MPNADLAGVAPLRHDVVVIAGRPLGADVPDAVQTLIAGRAYDVVWRNELGGLTFEVTARRGQREFIKWAPTGSGIDFAGEIARLAWAAPWTPVPDVLASGTVAEGSWIVTAGLPGEGAVSPRWLDNPRTAVTAIGEGLRALHDALPIEGCPFTWSADERIDKAREHARQHRTELAPVRTAPPIDRLVVCHGDACAPNTLIGDDGRWSGHVDFGALGTADRWADLAVATWSTVWNYGPGWEDHLLAAYGIDPDPERTEYYRNLWSLVP